MSFELACKCRPSKSDLDAGHRRADDLSLRRDPFRERLRPRRRAARRDATYDAEILRGIQDLRRLAARLQGDIPSLHLRPARLMRMLLIAYYY